MLTPDLPNVPPQETPVIIAQANQTQLGNVTTIRTIGVCSPTPSESANYSAENGLAPIAMAGAYFELYENRTVSGPATTTILEQPHHGTLRLVTEADGNRFGYGTFDAANQLYVYLPEGYLGNDKAVMQVEIGGVKVKVVYYFQAIGGALGSNWDEEYCSEKGTYWKISSTRENPGSGLAITHFSPSAYRKIHKLAVTLRAR